MYGIKQRHCVCDGHLNNDSLTIKHIIIIIVTRSFQPEPSAAAIVRQNGRSSDSCRASVVVTPVSRQIWWVQVVDGRPQARLHSREGRSPSLVLVQICRIWFAGTSRRSLATCPKRPYLRLRTMYETSNRPVRVRRRTSSLDTKSCLGYRAFSY